MNRIWYIDIAGKQEGPYSEDELRIDPRITPDTYVWRSGWEQWRRVRDVPELQDIFRDEAQPQDETDITPDVEKKCVGLEDELAIDYRQEPPYLFWLLAAAAILAYMIMQLYWN